MSERIQFNKLVGQTEEGFIFINEFHWNGVSTFSMEALTQDAVDCYIDNQDPEEIGHIWQEEVASGNTTLGLEDFFEEFMDSYDGLYLFHDTSFIHGVTNQDLELIESELGEQVVSFNCFGCGTGRFSEIKFTKIFDQELYEKALAHDLLKSGDNEIE